jgi:YggT family protein
MSVDAVFIIVFNLLAYYQYVLFIYILLTWIPSARETLIFRFFETLAGPFFRIFSGWLRFGQMDLTPIFGLILYGMLLQFAAGNVG